MKNLLGALAIVGCAAFAARAGADAEPATPAAGENVFGAHAKYRAATPAEAKAAVDRWLEKAAVAEDVRQKAADLWKADLPDPTGPRVLQRLVETFALVDARARQIGEVTARSHDRKDLPSLKWLADDKLDPLLGDNIRLLVGRWLCQEKLYDEALALLRNVKPENVVDPASLLFYRSVAYHRLLVKKEGLESIHSLLTEVEDSPQRYVSLGGLMEQDLQALKDGSLDDISRRMEDVERRLGLSRAGRVVRQKEDEIISMLDKLIEDLDKQCSQCQGTGSGSGNGPQRPANAPGVNGPTGPGTTNPRDAQGRGWGNLNDKERQEALQQLGKDFPAHYRAAIEQYFRRVASDTKTP